MERTDFLEHFRIFDSLESFRLPHGYERRILRLNSSEELVVDTSGISTGPLTGPEGENPFWTTDIFRNPPLTVRDLFGSGAGSDIPVVSQLPEMSATYTVPLDHFSSTPNNSTVMSDTQLVGPRSTISLQMAHSTMVPHVSTIPTGNVTPSQAPIGTPLRPNPSIPLGYRALNPSITNTTQVTRGSFISTPLFGGAGLGGSNPVGASGHSFTSGFQIPLGTQPHAGGQPPFGSQTQMGTQSQLGGQSQTGVPNPLYGQNVTQNPCHIPFPRNPLFPRRQHHQG